MRLLPLLLVATSLSAADDIAIGRFGRFLVVTAPVTGGSNPAVNQLLEQRVTIRFQDATVTEVADFIRKNTTLNVVVAPSAGLKPVSLDVQDMSLRHVLDWTCTVAHIRHTWLDGAIYLTDQAVVADRTATVMYDVGDLTLPLQDFPGPELGLGSGQDQNGVQVLPPVAAVRPPATMDDIEALVRRVVIPVAP
jgi:hypothetical protein